VAGISGKAGENTEKCPLENKWQCPTTKDVVGHCHLSAKGQNGLTCRHRKNDLALKLFEAYARSFFYPQPA
jgi:hypothetical protein